MMVAVVEEPRTTPVSAEPPAAGRAVSAARICGGVFLLTLAGYLLTASGHFVGQDQEYYFRTARAIALEGSFAIEPMNVSNEAGRIGPDGRFFAHYAPGLPIAMVPIVIVGRSLEGISAGIRSRYTWTARDEADKASRILVSYFNAPVTAATAALLALLVLRLGYPSGAAVFSALAYGFATFAWGQARVVFAEPLQGMLLLLGIVLLLRASPPRAVLGGAALALALMVKLTSLMALPVVLLLPDARGRPLWRSPTMVALVVTPLLAALALHGIFNFARFGDPSNTGYFGRSAGVEGAAGGAVGLLVERGFFRNPIPGLYGLLFSIGRGLVWYAPPIVASIWGYRAFARERRDIALTIGALSLLWLLFHAFWIGWHAGWGWGPRFLLPVLPLALVPLAHCWLERRARLTAIGLVGVGMVVQLPGALVDFWIAGREARALYLTNCLNCSDPRFYAFQYFTPDGSDFKIHTGLLRAGQLDLAWITFAGTWLSPLTIALVAVMLVAGFRLLWAGPIRGAVAARSADAAMSRRPRRAARRVSGGLGHR